MIPPARLCAKLIYSLVCKDLRLGVQPITLNKIFGLGFIPTFDVMLAEKYDDAPDNIIDILIDRGVIKIQGNQVDIMK